MSNERGELWHSSKHDDSTIKIIGSRALSFSDPYFHFTCLSVRHSVVLLVRERSALATLIFTSRVCLSVIRSVILSFCLSVRNFGAKYLGNEAR